MEKLNYQNLVFEGGGIKGIAYGGALQELEERDGLASVQRLAGTSAGAITATLLAIGYPASKVSELFACTNFKDFQDDSFGFFRDLWRLYKRFGFCRGNTFLKWISHHIAEQTGNPATTFAQLEALRRTRAEIRQLHVFATNLSRQRTERYCAATTPTMEIRQAVRRSMCFPFVFQAVRTADSDVVIDGGLAMNYPINAFDHQDFIVNPRNADPVDYNPTPGYCFNHETLGFKLVENAPLYPPTEPSVNKSIHGIKDFTMGMVDFWLQAAQRLHVHKKDWNRSVALDTNGVKVTEFDLPQAKIDTLLRNGRQGLVQFLKWRRSQPTELPLPGTHRHPSKKN